MGRTQSRLLPSQMSRRTWKWKTRMMRRCCTKMMKVRQFHKQHKTVLSLNHFRFSGAYRVGDIYIPPPIKPYCSNESKGSRLIITEITVNNFKSYAGEVTMGPFCHVIYSLLLLIE